jgi:Domain of unknown function (DUF4157)/DNA/RNA non-specific endonuclease
MRGTRVERKAANGPTALRGVPARVATERVVAGPPEALRATLQRKAAPPEITSPARNALQRRLAQERNGSPLPATLQRKMESLSGFDMSDVRVHTNAVSPATVAALAYTRGSDIHLAAGQEQHLAHEAWHVVQQKQQRVRPTMSLGGAAVNDDAALEREADQMGAAAMRGGEASGAALEAQSLDGGPVQRTVSNAIIYAVHAGLNYAWPPSVESFVALLRELKASADSRYEPLKAELLKGLSEEEAAAVEAALSGGTRFGDMDFPSSDELSDEDFPGTYTVPKKKKPTRRKDTGNISTSATFGGGKRPAAYGPVTIEKEKISHSTLGELERPVRVSGMVFPSATKGRPSAPEPSSGIKVGIKWKEVGSATTRNTGMVDVQKGHIMALELGGPDISSNIVPQWANWQGNGAWRRAEKQVLAMAEKAEEQGKKLHFDAAVAYKQYQVISQGTMKGLLVPTHFRITVTEYDPGTKTFGATKTIVFDEDQQRDATDDMMAQRQFDVVDQDVDSGSDSDVTDMDEGK